MPLALTRSLRNRLCTCLLWLLASAVTSLASTESAWVVRTWRTDDGLPNNYVPALAQTPDGFIWLANHGDLARFDGATFELISCPSFGTIADRKVNVVLRRRKGGLWLATDHSALFQLESGTVRAFTNGLPNMIAWQLVEDGQDALWITYGGSTVCRLKDGNVTRFNRTNGMPVAPRSGCSIAADRDGKIWLATAGKLEFFNGTNFETALTVGSSDIPVRITTAGQGGLWICADSHILHWQPGSAPAEFASFKSDQPASEPTVLMEDRNGAVWVGTSSSGLFRCVTNGFEHVPTSHNSIFGLLEDREGCIWVGTGGGGLDQIRPCVARLEQGGNGVSLETVQSLCEDSQTNVWATLAGGQILRRDHTGWNIVSSNVVWSGGRATCVTADRSGAVWIGTRVHQLVCWQDGHFRVAARLPCMIVHALLADSNGDVWVGGEVPEFLGRIHNGVLEAIALPPNIRIIRAMAEDNSGNLWLGTSLGVLLRVTNGKVFDETANTTGSPVSIRCLHATPDGTLWIGYVGSGIGRYKDGKFARIGPPEGLFDGIVSQIASDQRGWLWLGSDHGIFKVREQELADVAEGRAAAVRPIHYGRDDGLPSVQASAGDSPGAIQTRDCRIWFPTLTGVAIIDPRRLREDPNPPAVLLRRISVDDQVVAAYGSDAPLSTQVDLKQDSATIQLPPGHRRLQFDFTALTFGAPENVHFRYRLQGIDDNWIPGGPQRSASYSRLPAGRYRFQVQACNGDGFWNETGAAFGFSVTPFFWQTWWFRCCAFACLVFAVTGIGRYIWFHRLQLRLRELEQKAALDRERSRIARDIHDDLGGSLTQTSLLLELARKNRADTGKVDAYLGQTSASIIQVVGALDEIVWAVNPGNDTLPHLLDYVGQFAAGFMRAANIRCRVDLPDDPPNRPLAPEVRHNLFLVVKESLNNIVRHANAREVRLWGTVSAENLSLTIEDDGHGFAQEPPDSAEANGLRNMRQRMADIGGRCLIESKPGFGTRVSVFLIWPPAKSGS